MSADIEHKSTRMSHSMSQSVTGVPTVVNENSDG